MRVVVLAVLAAFAFVTPAAAQPWSGPDPSRRAFMMGHAVENFDLAIAEVCFPYLLQNADEASLRRTGVFPRSPAPASFGGASTLWVGREVTAGVKQEGDARSCTIMVESGDPAALRAVLQTRLEQMPGAMTPGGYQFPPGNYASRELLCAPAAGPHDAALISTGPRSDGARAPTIMVTLTRSPTRNARCDGAAPEDAAQRQSQFPPDSFVARTAVALSVCRLVLAGGAPDTVAAMQGVTLQPAQRFGDTPVARDSTLARLFDQDDQVYALHEAKPNDPDFSALFVFVERTGSKCLVSADGRGNLGAAMGLGLGAGWRRDGDTGLRGPNGERLRLTSTGSATSFYFTRR